jgi:hypothetical protein
VFERRLTVIVGHFGSGKTEIAVNGALCMASRGQPVSLVDLDVVKPYFRSREACQVLQDAGIELVAPGGESATADLPIILPRVRAVCRDTSRRVLVDAGGDATGARVLGSLSDVLDGLDMDFLLVLNFRRPFTYDVDSAVAMARGIETVARRKLTGVVSNTHLMAETTIELVNEGLRYSRDVAEILGVDVRAVVIEDRLADCLGETEAGCEVFHLTRVVQPGVGTPRPRTQPSGPPFVVR